MIGTQAIHSLFAQRPSYFSRQKFLPLLHSVPPILFLELFTKRVPWYTLTSEQLIQLGCELSEQTVIVTSVEHERFVCFGHHPRGQTREVAVDRLSKSVGDDLGRIW